MAIGRKTGGRTKGVPNKFTRSVKEAMEAAFSRLQRDPKAKLTAWAKQNPTEFYKLAAKLIPQQVNLAGKLTLEQLVQQASKDETGA